MKSVQIKFPEQTFSIKVWPWTQETFKEVTFEKIQNQCLHRQASSILGCEESNPFNVIISNNKHSAKTSHYGHGVKVYP